MSRLLPGLSATQITRYLGGPADVNLVFDWTLVTTTGAVTTTVDIGAAEPGRFFVLQCVWHNTASSGSVTPGTHTLDGEEFILGQLKSVGSVRNQELTAFIHKPTGTGNVDLVMQTSSRMYYRLWKVTNALLRNWQTHDVLTAATTGMNLVFDTVAGHSMLATIESGQESSNNFNPDIPLTGGTADFTASGTTARAQGSKVDMVSTGAYSVGGDTTTATKAKTLTALMFEPLNTEDKSKIGVEIVVPCIPVSENSSFDIELGPADAGRYFVLLSLGGRGGAGAAVSDMSFTLGGSAFTKNRTAFNTTNRSSFQLDYIHYPTGTGKATLANTVTGTAGNHQLMVFRVTRAQLDTVLSTGPTSDTTGLALSRSGLGSGGVGIGAGMVMDDITQDTLDRNIWDSTYVLGGYQQVVGSSTNTRASATLLRGSSVTVEQKGTATAKTKINKLITFTPL